MAQTWLEAVVENADTRCVRTRPSRRRILAHIAVAKAMRSMIVPLFGFGKFTICHLDYQKDGLCGTTNRFTYASAASSHLIVNVTIIVVVLIVTGRTA